VATWLYRIAHHRAVSWLRASREVVALEKAPEIPTTDTPSQQAMQAWRAEQVHRALSQLSPEHRAVLELTFFHGFSYREIAHIIGCPVGTVKSRMSYARRRIGKLLQALGVES
jgi:RNA polymerase sigma-70 factor (ECF subfamily)